ncbi:MAG: hypothetical protein V3S68_03635 [Dehalococcoidia bacterium]
MPEPKVEVLVIVTLTGDEGPVSKPFQGKGIADALAALKNADRAMDLIIAEDDAWHENRRYRYREQLQIREEQLYQTAMEQVKEGRQGQDA